MRSTTVGGLFLLIALTSCTSWRVQQVSPEQLLNDERPRAVRVQRTDSSRVILNNPQLVHDSLQGMIRGQRAGIPLTDITQIGVRRGNDLKTIGLILGIAATPFVFFALVCGSQGCNFGQ
jgi:hypothetical protein